MYISALPCSAYSDIVAAIMVIILWCLKALCAMCYSMCNYPSERRQAVVEVGVFGFMFVLFFPSLFIHTPDCLREVTI